MSCLPSSPRRVNPTTNQQVALNEHTENENLKPASIMDNNNENRTAGDAGSTGDDAASTKSCPVKGGGFILGVDFGSTTLNVKLCDCQGKDVYNHIYLMKSASFSHAFSG